jgi:hypothetical protein
MKRLVSLLVALFFMSGLVVAQNNSSFTTQNGDDNKATVTQEGKKNESLINQQSYENTSTVKQDGEKNFSDIKQATMGDAYVEQIGKKNESRLNQAGLNEADIKQEGEENKVGSYYGYDSPAKQKNGYGVFTADMNFMDVDQKGEANKAGITQRHHADATIMQEGKENKIKLFQSGSPAGMMNVADLKQVGEGNMFEVFQYGEGNEAIVKLTKAGNGAASSDNMVNVTQGSSSPWDKSGDGNYFKLTGNRSNENTVDAEQIGSYNFHRIGIEGDNNSIDLKATGNSNRGDWSIAEPTWPAKSNDNSLTLIQDGNTNYATGYIAGDGNTVTILQKGNNNLVGSDWYTENGVAIDGNYNTVDVDQMSNGNQSMNTIMGNSNSITVTQD